MTPRFRSVRDTIGLGCALLAAIQLPGALLDLVIRRGLGLPLISVLVLSAAALLLLRPWSRSLRPTASRLAGAAVVAFAIASVVAQAATVLMRFEVVEVSDIGILVPAPGKSTECRGQPRRCHEIVLNELGLRGALPSRTDGDTTVVAFVGDSHIFGAGVGEQDTVPAVAARSLGDLRPAVTVVNAGIQGINGASFPGVVRYVQTRLDPDLIVALVKDDDLDQTDKFTRWRQFRSSFWFRLMSVTNLETVYETVRLLARYWFPESGREAALRQTLDAIAAAVGHAKLLIVAVLANDLQPTYREWLAAHPNVGQVSLGDDPRFWAAERIPHDGHWTEAGCKTVAEMMVPAVRAQLAAPAAMAGG